MNSDSHRGVDRAASVFNGASVLVTGHTGFKGSWLSLWLSRLGARVTGISIDVPTRPSHFDVAQIGDCVEDRRVDIRDGPALYEAVQASDPDFVFHLAAQALVRRAYADPVSTWQTNALGSVNVLEALRRRGKRCVAVMITSDKCYDNAEWVWGYRETDPLGGPDPYSASKGAAELAIRSYVRSYFRADGLLRIAVGRAGNVIGGGDWASDRIVPDCMRAWSQGETVRLRNPNATRPWQHVLEPLSGYLALALELHGDAAAHGEPFNFGPPAQQDHTVGELVTAIGAHWSRARWESEPTQGDKPHESALLKLNCDKALHRLGWHATWDFSQTVRQTALWYREYHEGSAAGMRDFSSRQIAEYAAHARALGLAWAR